MNKNKKRKDETVKLTAHGLLGSLSYWGTTARSMLVSVFIAFAFVINLARDGSASFVEAEILFLIFGLATLVMLDLGYVVAARSLPLNKVVDRWVVMMSDIVLAAFFVIPSLIVIGADGNVVRVLSLIIALLVVSVRILVGLLFGKRK